MSSYVERFAIGTTLAGMVNIESLVGVPPTYLPSGRAPLLGPVKRKVGSGRTRRDGAKAVDIVFERMTRVEYRAFLLAALGSLTIASAKVYLSLVDDLGYVSPFFGWLDRPFSPDDITDFTQTTMNRVVFPFHDYQLQSVSKSSNYTLTTADHLIYMDTSGGSRTIALPPAANANTEVIYSAVKPVAANSLILDPNSSELIDGASTKTITAANGRVDFYSTGSAWLSWVDGE